MYNMSADSLNTSNLLSIFADPEYLETELNKCKVTAMEVITEPPACYSINNTTVGTLGNISMFIGKAKQGKTYAISMAMAAAESSSTFNDVLKIRLPVNKNKVILFDTEQSRYHLQIVVKRIAKLVNVSEPENLTTYGLRAYQPSERLALIEHKIYNTPNLGFVIIDGIRDLVTGINDEPQATMISNKLLKWSQDLGIHIIVVLHMNKGDSNARGHLGTELQNKAESIFAISKEDQDKRIISVQPVSTRGEEPAPFAFSIDEAGIPFILDNWESGSSTKRAKQQQGTQPWEVDGTTHMEFLKPLFAKQTQFTSKDLLDAIRMNLKRWISVNAVSRDRAAEWKAYLISQGIIIQHGTPGTKSVRFSLAQ